MSSYSTANLAVKRVVLPDLLSLLPYSPTSVLGRFTESLQKQARAATRGTSSGLNRLPLGVLFATLGIIVQLAKPRSGLVQLIGLE